jgi:hypothetical protein
MADKRPKGHNPSEKSLQRWDNEGGAIKGVRAKRPRDPNQLGKLVVDIATGQVEDRPSRKAKAAKQRRFVSGAQKHAGPEKNHTR